MPVSFGVFSDESSHTNARFRSICALSIPAEYVVEVQNELSKLLDGSNVSEFKWQKLRSARYRECAKKLIDYLLTQLIPYKTRLDTLIWDTEDRRHDVIGRDDTKNFERMFFHLHNNLMTRRSYEARWHLRPDERTDINWDDIQKCLESAGKWKEYFNKPLLKDVFSKEFYHIKTLKEVDSKEYQLVQLSDLFAGMGAYSRKRKTKIRKMFNQESGQKSFFANNRNSFNISNADEDRFKVIKYLYKRSREKKLGLSLKTNGYFITHNPTNPINFWHYTPQHDDDQAPLRNET